jgi:uncharacterized membrane protein YvlD (DUF360 family)
MTPLLIKLAVRFVVFGAVFGIALRRNKKVSIQPKIALPVVALVFALLNTGLYWLLKPVLNFATLGAAWLLLPFALNATFLWATRRLIRPLKIEGTMTMLWLAVWLTAAHGLCWFVLDVLVYGK